MNNVEAVKKRWLIKDRAWPEKEQEADRDALPEMWRAAWLQRSLLPKSNRVSRRLEGMLKFGTDCEATVVPSDLQECFEIVFD